MQGLLGGLDFPNLLHSCPGSMTTYDAFSITSLILIAQACHGDTVHCEAMNSSQVAPNLICLNALISSIGDV